METSYEWLFQKHHIEKLSTREMGKLCGIDHKTVLYRMKKMGIPRRDRLEVMNEKLPRGEANQRFGKRGRELPYYGRKHTEEELGKMRGYRGEKCANWRGGISHHADGYIWRRADDHPCASNSGGYVLEHRLVVEAQIGRYLTPEEVVHHINGIKNDNRPENLMLLPSKSEHVKLHKRDSKGRIAS